jgi:glutamate synthase domain-containing protein 1
MEHRGASSADNISGDGAGIDRIMILCQIFKQTYVVYIICPYAYEYIQEYLSTKLSHISDLPN